MSESSVPLRSLAVGPSDEGLWIVRDERGACGAVFSRRELALSFAKAECAAAGSSEWRLVASLDLSAMFTPAG